MLKIALLTGAIQGLILSWLLTTRRENRSSNRLFAFLLFLLSIHLTLVAFDERDFFMRFPHFSHITWLLPVLYGPLMLLYVRRVTRLAPSFRAEEGLYFLPFIIWFIILLPYYLQSAAAKRAYLSDFAASVRDDFGALNQMTNFVHLFFFALCVWVYHRHEERIRQYYSDLTRVRLIWLRDFLYIAVAIVVLGVFIFYARKFEWPYLSALYPIHFLGIVIAIYWTAYKALAQPALFSDLPAPSYASEQPTDAGYTDMATGSIPSSGTGAPATFAGSRLDPEVREKLARQLLDLMKEEKLFLNSELTLQDLTERLSSNRQYVSETLNQYFDKNFYDFVNDYRIGEFKRLAADPGNRHLTLLALALESGFNSKATFNAVFKKKTGLTPSEFMKEAGV